MTKKDEKFGFTRRDAYDVSQRSLSLADKVASHRRSESGRSATKDSSYNSEPPSQAVLKRLKLR